MVEKLLDAGYSLKIYNRTIEKTKPIAALDAQVSSSLEEAVRGAEVVFTSVIDDNVQD